MLFFGSRGMYPSLITLPLQFKSLIREIENLHLDLLTGGCRRRVGRFSPEIADLFFERLHEGRELSLSLPGLLLGVTTHFLRSRTPLPYKRLLGLDQSHLSLRRLEHGRLCH